MLIGKKPQPRLNNEIKADEVRLISERGEQLGVVTTKVALNKARDVGLDLIEIAPNAKPPVCKILDHGKLKYEEKKNYEETPCTYHIIWKKQKMCFPIFCDIFRDIFTQF